MLSHEDEEYAQQVSAYTKARNDLARARIARGFYPVVVPAESGGQPRFGRGSSKGKPKGKGNSKENKPVVAMRPRPKANSKGTGSPAPQWGRPDRPAASSDGGAGRPSPICCRCGKRGHLSSNCTNAPLPKRNKATDSASVVFDMTPMG